MITEFPNQGSFTGADPSYIISEENKNEIMNSKRSSAQEQLQEDPAESVSSLKKEEDIQLSLKVNINNNYLMS
jgi:hypothetical protein